MADTHDYPTKTIKAKDLTKAHVLVGTSGGLSAVYENIPLAGTQGFGKGVLTIATEHGSLRMHEEQAVNVYHEKRSASQIRDDIDTLLAAGETKEYVDAASVWERIDELVEDLLDSVTLVMGAEHEDLEVVVTTVRDYYANNYGSD